MYVCMHRKYTHGDNGDSRAGLENNSNFSGVSLMPTSFLISGSERKGQEEEGGERGEDVHFKMIFT